MKFLVDMNLSPKWCAIPQAEGWESRHWSNVGIASAADHVILQLAVDQERVVLTNDLGFGAMLAATQAEGPSVVQVRTHDVRPRSLARVLIPLLHQYQEELEAGALLNVDEARSRLRILPLSRA